MSAAHAKPTTVRTAQSQQPADVRTAGDHLMLVLDAFFAVALVALFNFIFRKGSDAVLAFAWVLAATHALGALANALRFTRWRDVLFYTSAAQLAVALIVMLLLVQTASHVTAVYGDMGGPANVIFVILALLVFEVFGLFPAAKVVTLLRRA